jgi:hypothetical protein
MSKAFCWEFISSWEKRTLAALLPDLPFDATLPYWHYAREKCGNYDDERMSETVYWEPTDYSLSVADKIESISLWSPLALDVVL